LLKRTSEFFPGDYALPGGRSLLTQYVPASGGLFTDACQTGNGEFAGVLIEMKSYPATSSGA